MKQFNSNTKLGQVITKEVIANWRGDVILNAGTATGKTTLILTNLSEYCTENNQTILFVCNRKALADVVKSDIKKSKIKNVDVTTYQTIESNLKNKNEFTLDYDWIALDEFHHVLECYNYYTDLSFKYITSHTAQKIYMSATCEALFDTFIENGKVSSDQYYYIEKDYKYITKLSFYNKKDDHNLIIKDKLENTTDKIIFFTQSLNRAKETYIDYRDVATFFCSSYTSDSMAKKFLKECKGDIDNETFRGRLLIATSALDVGITLLDKSIKTIILDIYTWQTLIQCLGRKRLVDELDTCEVYIRDYHRGNLNIYHNNQFKSLDMFINNPDEFHNTYGKDREFHSPYIFKDAETGEWSANVVAYFSFQQAEKDLDVMTKVPWQDRYGEGFIGMGYKNFIISKLKIDELDTRIENYDNVKERVHMKDLNEYLESIVGNVMLTAKDRNELIEKINIRDGKNNRLLKGINILNGALMEGNYNFIIKEFETSRVIDDKKKKFKNAWKVLRVSE